MDAALTDEVADISVISPAPAYVTVSVLSRDNNGVAPDDLLAIVRKGAER